MKPPFAVMTMCLACLTWWATAPAQGQDMLTLENGRLGLSFDRTTGTLVAIRNKLAGETYQVRGDEFEVEAVAFRTALGDAKLASVQCQTGKGYGSLPDGWA